MQNDGKKCPYLYADDQYTGKCKISGGTNQSGYDFERYCKNKDNLQQCANYQGRDKNTYP